MPKTHQESAYLSRFQKPSFKNPKFLIGILLIASSILAVVVVLHIGNKTEPYYVAKKDIKLGERVSIDDFKLVDVKLSEAASQYLPKDYKFGSQEYATTFIRSGELVRTQSINHMRDDSRREVVISLDSAVAANLNLSDKVDIWVSEKIENSTQYRTPQAIMTGAEVSNKNSEESIIGGTGKTSVSLLVLPESLPRVLNAINNQAKITLIPTNYAQEQVQR